MDIKYYRDDISFFLSVYSLLIKAGWQLYKICWKGQTGINMWIIRSIHISLRMKQCPLTFTSLFPLWRPCQSQPDWMVTISVQPLGSVEDSSWTFTDLSPSNRVIILLSGVETSAQSEVLRVLPLLFIKDISVLCSIQFQDQSQLLKNTPAALMLPPPHFTIGMVLLVNSAWFKWGLNASCTENLVSPEAETL